MLYEFGDISVELDDVTSVYIFDSFEEDGHARYEVRVKMRDGKPHCYAYSDECSRYDEALWLIEAKYKAAHLAIEEVEEIMQDIVIRGLERCDFPQIQQPILQKE